MYKAMVKLSTRNIHIENRDSQQKADRG